MITTVLEKLMFVSERFESESTYIANIRKPTEAIPAAMSA